VLANLNGLATPFSERNVFNGVIVFGLAIAVSRNELGGFGA
jgi:hypothetical protein